MRRPAFLILVAAALCGALSVVAVVSQPVPFTGRSAERVVLETAATLVALLGAFLFLGRYRHTRRLDQLTTAAVLFNLSLANLLIVAIVVSGTGRGTVWDLVIGAHVAAAVLFVVAGFVPMARPRRPVRAALALAAGTVAILVIADAVIHALAGTLPGTEPQPAYNDVAHAERHAGIFTLQLVAAAAFAVAAVGLARRSFRTRDELLAWMAVAAVFSATAQVDYLLVPPWRLDWFGVGDLFRLLAYAILLLAALREIGSYWRRLAESAVLEERRRIARELHDGLAQELALIDRRARALAETQDSPALRQIVGATERAVLASRRAIAVLTRPLDEPLDRVLAQAAEDVAARTGLPISLSLAPDVEIPRDAREALVRIACEAITNAAKHSGATRVRLELENGSRVRMRVVDDGVGFDPGSVGDGGPGFGLSLMRERGCEIGATLAVRSRVGQGTTVEVELP